MSFDLVVTARDSKTEFLRFFDSVVKQDGGLAVHVLFADQELDLSREELFPAGHFGSVELTILPVHKSSLSIARNYAIERGGLRSSFVAFPDDDCWYEPTLLQKIRAEFDSSPEIDCICTHVFDPDRKLSYGHRPRDTRVRIDFSNIFYLPISVGIFIRREALERAGAYFDTKLGAGTALGSGEETELIARLLESGSKIVYVGSISVFHAVPVYQPEDSKKYYLYGVGFGYLAIRFILRGHLQVGLQWLNIVCRSLAGYILSILRGTRQLVYWERFRGIMNGSYRAISRGNRE